jgi:uncharacterized delta-60 repeat protein
MRRAWWAGTLALIALLAPLSDAWGKAGDLDRSYGLGTGASRIDFGGLPGATGTTDIGFAVALQPDGRILVAGQSNALGTNDFAVARVLADQGTFDGSFAGTGRSLTNLGSIPGSAVASSDDVAVAVAPQGDRILLAGHSTFGGTRDFAVLRLTQSGAIDLDYGGGSGASRMDFGTDFNYSLDLARAMAVQPDGRIVVAGLSNSRGSPHDPDMAVARVVSPQGTFDGAFNGTGRQLVNFGSLPGYNYASVDLANAVALQGDRIILAGGTNLGGTSDLAVARLTAGGAIDLGYGLGTGGSLIDFGGLPGATGSNDTGLAVAVQRDGRIVVAGQTDAFGTPSFAVARVLATEGTNDASFAGTGRTVVDWGTTASANAVAVQPDGKILVAGNVAGDIGVARLQPNGTLDSSFGQGGKARIDLGLGAVETANAIALRADGKIVLAGTVTAGTPPNPDMLVVRLENDAGGASGGGKGPAGAGGGKSSRCAGKRATIVGTNGKDRLRGTKRADVIVGLGGKDRISGLGGKDRICGGTGDDRLDGGNGDDRVNGQAGKDRVKGGKGKDRLKGGSGNDLLDGGAGADRLEGQGGRDKLLGRGGRDRLKGGPGKDTQRQ